MNKTAVLIMILSLIVPVSWANDDAEIAQGKQLVESDVNCEKLTDDQLESIGEYYMESMHPGPAHDAMHVMMGPKEGTPQHEAVHVQIAQMMYCNKGYGAGMMGMMYARGNTTGFMPMMGSQMMYGGMMGGWGNYGLNGGATLWMIILLGLVVVVWLWVIKLFKEVFKKR